MGRKQQLIEQSHDMILAHILNPEESPLPENQQAQLARVRTAAQLFDNYPDRTHVAKLLMEKYRIGRSQAMRDIAVAREIFMTDHDFDWDFWRAWEIKDQIDLIKRCRDKENLKEWNNAKKVLHEMIGEKPAAIDDPKRMEKTTFNITVNNGTGTPVSIPLEVIRSLSREDLKALIDTLSQPVDDAEAEELFNS